MGNQIGVNPAVTCSPKIFIQTYGMHCIILAYKTLVASGSIQICIFE